MLREFCVLGRIGLGLVAMAMGGCADMLSEISTASIKPVADNVNQQFVPGVPRGYQCPLVPNGFDPAGSIYRVDKDGTYFRVKDFGSDAAITALPNYKREVPISNYVLNDTQQANAGMSMDLLKKVVPGLTASGSADYKKAMTVEITVEDMVGEVIDDAVADKIVELFKTSMTPKANTSSYAKRCAQVLSATSSRRTIFRNLAARRKSKRWRRARPTSRFATTTACSRSSKRSSRPACRSASSRPRS
jgi:hypothetical protein